MEAWRKELYHDGVRRRSGRYPWGSGKNPFHHTGNRLRSEGKLDEKRKEEREKIKKLEEQAIHRTYKKNRKNGESFVFKSARSETGENMKKAEEQFKENILSDNEYRRLSKTAELAEDKRLKAEKKAYDKSEEEYSRFVSSDEGRALEKESMEATNKKNQYVDEMAKKYVDTIKEAKMKDMNISEHDKAFAKEYVSDRFYSFVWDGKLEYNPNNYYD